MLENDFFEAIVVGENPKDIMLNYDIKLKTTTPYIKYRYADAEKIKADKVRLLSAMISSNNHSSSDIEEYKEERKEILSQNTEDFFFDYTSRYEHDTETGDAITDENPNGHWSFFQEGKLFSIPFITKDGREVYQARKGEIDWSLMHLNGKEIYEAAWDMVMGKRKPKTPYEKQIYENMKNRKVYFSNFKNKEHYVVYSTAFWAYAFVTKNGWFELEEHIDSYTWVSNFYDKFIKPLSDNTLLTIYECKK